MFSMLAKFKNALRKRYGKLPFPNGAKHRTTAKVHPIDLPPTPPSAAVSMEDDRSSSSSILSSMSSMSSSGDTIEVFPRWYEGLPSSPPCIAGWVAVPVDEMPDPALPAYPPWSSDGTHTRLRKADILRLPDDGDMTNVSERHYSNPPPSPVRQQEDNDEFMEAVDFNEEDEEPPVQVQCRRVILPSGRRMSRYDADF